MPRPTLYLIDGYAQFFRAFHAIRTPMSSPVTKEPTNLTFGFIGMLLKLLRGTANMGGPPTHIAVVLDVSGDRGTFRSQLYPEYKATRPPPPEGLKEQVERCLRTLEALRIPAIGSEGFEADDAAATIVHRLASEHPEMLVRMVSKDKDLKQLLDEGRVELFDVHTDEVFTADTLLRDTGLKPRQVIDMLALMGDTVDNVPGVPGVGPKTASELIAQYGSLDELLAKAHEIKGKRGEKIRETAPALGLSRELVTLRTDTPLEFDLGAASVERFDLGSLIPILKELGFNRYQDEVRALLGHVHPAEDKTAFMPTGGPEGTRSLGTSAAGAGASAESAVGGVSGAGASAPAKAKRSRAAEADDGGGLFAHLSEDAPGAVPQFAPSATRGEYRCVKTRGDLDELIAELRGAELIALDTETTGLSPLESALCGLSFSTRERTGWYVPVRSPDGGAHLDERTVLEALRPILEDPSKPKCGHNLKFDMLVLRAALGGVGSGGVEGGGGVRLRGLCAPAGYNERHPGVAWPGGDSMVASYLIDSGRSSHGLDALALALLGHTNIAISELIGSGTKQRTFDTVALDAATQYAGEDADISLRLNLLMAPQLRAMGLRDLYERVEIPLVEVLADLEWNGVLVDPGELDRQRLRLVEQMNALRGQIDAAARESLGRTFNPDSPRQLAAALFNKPDHENPGEAGLGIKPVKRTATGYSTDVEVLEKLAEDASVTTPIPRLIVDYRQLSKLVGTYLVSLKEAINPQTKRIHSSFNQTVAATGRLASSDPNLQNIPIRTDVGRDIRKAFVAPAGKVLVSADYSQIELRLLAHLSQDPNLIEAFLQGADIHTAVAAQIHGVALEQVTKPMRNSAKMVNFGIVYGVTAFGLARRLGIGTSEAEQIITAYKKRYAGITTFLQECIEQARRHGYVETMLKRRRAIPDIESTNPSRRSLGERLAINSVVQGSAADLIKVAMVNIHAEITGGCAGVAGGAGGAGGAAGTSPLSGTRMLLQIHDELVFESPEAEAAGARDRIVELMESAMTLCVPLKADSAMARDWFEGK